MRVQITARNGRIADAIRARAERGVASLRRFEPRMSAADIVFEEVGSQNRVEILVTVDGTDMAVAHAEVRGIRRALDLALDRVRGILTKHREQSRDHRGTSLTDALGET